MEQREQISKLVEDFIKSLQWRELTLSALRGGMRDLANDIDNKLALAEDIQESFLEQAHEHCEVCQNSEWADECSR